MSCRTVLYNVNKPLGLSSTMTQPTSFTSRELWTYKESEFAHSFYAAASENGIKTFFVISPRYIPKLHLGEKLNSQFTSASYVRGLLRRPHSDETLVMKGRCDGR